MRNWLWNSGHGFLICNKMELDKVGNGDKASWYDESLGNLSKKCWDLGGGKNKEFIHMMEEEEKLCRIFKKSIALPTKQFKE